MNIEQLMKEVWHALQNESTGKCAELLNRCYVALSEQADLLRRAEMSVENCDMYRERGASVPDALRATPVAQQKVVMPDNWKQAVDNVAGYAHLYHSGAGIVHEIYAEHARLNGGQKG